MSRDLEIPRTPAFMTTEELREELRRAVNLTARSVAYLAEVWTELERRGEDMSDIRIGLAPFLRDVAAGRLAPEAVLTFAGSRMVLRWVGRRPLAEQKRLASGAPVEVPTEEGPRQIPATQLTVQHLRMLQKAREERVTGRRQRRGPRPMHGRAMKAVVTFMMPNDMRDEIARLAAARRKPVSEIMREAVALYLRETRNR